MKLSKKDMAQADKLIREMSNYFIDILLDNDIAIYVLEVLLVNCLNEVICHIPS